MPANDPITTPRETGPAVVREPGWGEPDELRYRPIESYGLIGDLRTAALVGRDGAIDWFCPGRFDAPSLFASVLDADIGGSFRIAPAVPCASKQLYLPDTAILLTRFFSLVNKCGNFDSGYIINFKGYFTPGRNHVAYCSAMFEWIRIVLQQLCLWGYIHGIIIVSSFLNND